MTPQPNAEARITLRLAPHERQVRLRELRRLVGNLAKCLDHFAQPEARQGKAPEFAIANLFSRSASIEVMPDNIYPAEGEIAIVRFQKTVRSLHDDSANGEVDVRGLELIRTLAQPVAKRNADLWFNELQLTTQFLANIDKRLDKPIRAYGNLKGVLEQINVHGRNEFVIYPPIRTKGIRCAFLEQLTEKVGASIRKSVTVRGMMLYLPDAAFPHFVEVDELTTHPQDSELPSLRDLRGIAPNCTGGMSTLDFLRSLHNE